MQVAISPLIPANTKMDSNTTRIMKTTSVNVSQSLTDNIATIANGYVSNLLDPTANNEIATKYYVDNFAGSGSAGGPTTSVQINDGEIPDGFIGYSTLTYSSNTLNVDTLTNNTITINSGTIDGLLDPIEAQQSSNKNYVDLSATLSLVNVISDPANGYIYTAAEFINTIIIRSFYSNLNSGISCSSLDILPLLDDVKTFLGDKFQVGYSWTTVIRFPTTSGQIYASGIIGSEEYYTVSPVTYFCGFPIGGVSLLNYSSVTINSVIKDITLGSEIIVAYIIATSFDITQNSQISNQGILTPSYINPPNSAGIIIYPLIADPTIDSVSPVNYTYSIIKTQFVIRTGLTGDTIDTFDSAVNILNNDAFLMGSGTFRFSIQNISAFNLTLSPGVGWTVQANNSLVIPSNYCGNFWITAITSSVSCIIRNLGIFPLNGP